MNDDELFRMTQAGRLGARLSESRWRQGAWLLASDVEGPLFLGDFIAEALSHCVKPAVEAIEATPSYGQILYGEGYAAFSADILPQVRTRGAGARQPRPEQGYVLAQEGTDTIFALPLLLAAQGSYASLEAFALRSTPTPGARLMVESLAREGWQMAGITTASEQPYRELASRQGWLEAGRLFGSPFPLREAEAMLRRQGRWESELGLARAYVFDACELVDRYSEVWMDGATRRRQLSDAGRRLLRDRFRRFYREELGISYAFGQRRTRPAHTLLGRIVEASAMVGDRAKAAIALSLARRAGGVARLVAMGDGANDAAMLGRARWSIGVNGPEAARAAAIGLVTDNMEHALVLLRLIAKGDGDIDAVIGRAKAELSGAAWVHRGGPDISDEWADRHKQMKKRLRGEFVTY